MRHLDRGHANVFDRKPLNQCIDKVAALLIDADRLRSSRVNRNAPRSSARIRPNNRPRLIHLHFDRRAIHQFEVSELIRSSVSQPRPCQPVPAGSDFPEIQDKVTAHHSARPADEVQDMIVLPEPLAWQQRRATTPEAVLHQVVQTFDSGHNSFHLRSVSERRAESICADRSGAVLTLRTRACREANQIHESFNCRNRCSRTFVVTHHVENHVGDGKPELLIIAGEYSRSEN